MAEKKAGKTFNVTLGTKDAEGKTSWTPFGRVFVLEDCSEGTLYVGAGDEEKKLKLVPNEGVTKTGGKSFDVMDKQGERYARLFIRADMTGGALWVGEGDDEVQYALFPPKGKPGAAPAASAAAKTATA